MCKCTYVIVLTLCFVKISHSMWSRGRRFHALFCDTERAPYTHKNTYATCTPKQMPNTLGFLIIGLIRLINKASNIYY